MTASTKDLLIIEKDKGWSFQSLENPRELPAGWCCAGYRFCNEVERTHKNGM